MSEFTINDFVMPKSDYYYGSRLNKYMNSKLGRTFTVNNIDCIMYKWKYINGYKHHFVRIIEVKMQNECFGQNQDLLLELLSQLSAPKNIHYDVYNYRGGFKNETNNDVDVDLTNEIFIYSYSKKETRLIKDEDTLKKWLKFEIEFDALKKKLEIEDDESWLDESI